MRDKPGIKPGVHLTGVRPEIILAVMIACAHHPRQTFTITSALDGRHMSGSKHYSGQAVDLRTVDIDRPEAIKWRNSVALALGKSYDVILEDDHLHIEYDPKDGHG